MEGEDNRKVKSEPSRNPPKMADEPGLERPGEGPTAITPSSKGFINPLMYDPNLSEHYRTTLIQFDGWPLGAGGDL